MPGSNSSRLTDHLRRGQTPLRGSFVATQIVYGAGMQDDDDDRTWKLRIEFVIIFLIVILAYANAGAKFLGLLPAAQ